MTKKDLEALRNKHCLEAKQLVSATRSTTTIMSWVM